MRYLQSPTISNIDGLVSSSGTITFEVPQGTALEHVLFNIYINSLLQQNTDGMIFVMQMIFRSVQIPDNN